MALPWLTPPAQQQRTVIIGDETTGTLELPVHGDLLWGETVTISELLESEESTTTNAAQLAEAIAAAEDLTLLDAYDLVQAAVLGTALPEEHRDRMVRYQADIDRLRGLFTRIGQVRMSATVTAIVRHRLDPDWTPADTAKLPARLFDALWAFAESERAPQPVEPPTEDDLKKQPPATTRRRTGKQLSGA